MGTPCFLLEKTTATRAWLRRYAGIADEKREHNPCGSYHDAVRWLGDYPDGLTPKLDEDFDRDDERWPTTCDGCGYAFHPFEDTWQIFTLSLWEVVRSVDESYVKVGGIFHVHMSPVFDGAAPPGAMLYADWLTESMDKWDPEKPWAWNVGPDGRALTCRVPGMRDWQIDSRASNCALPEDNEHRCWVRSGEPPFVTVGKNGLTCAAGAGSIQAGDYHGFLVDGVLS